MFTQLNSGLMNVFVLSFCILRAALCCHTRLILHVIWFYSNFRPHSANLSSSPVRQPTGPPQPVDSPLGEDYPRFIPWRPSPTQSQCDPSFGLLLSLADIFECGIFLMLLSNFFSLDWAPACLSFYMLYYLFVAPFINIFLTPSAVLLLSHTIYLFTIVDLTTVEIYQSQ